MLRTLMLVVTCALLMAASSPKEQGLEKALADEATALVEDLKDPDKATAAAGSLLLRGDDAVPALAKLLRSGAELPARGWAVVILTDIGSDAALTVLEEVSRDTDTPVLVRTWANAGRLLRARSLDELLGHAALLETSAALERPFARRADELLGQEVLVADLELAERDAKHRELVLRLLKAGQSQPQLQRALFPVLRTFKLPALPVLVEIALHGEPAALRQVAAEHIVSMGRRRSGDSITAALDALKETPFASAPPLASVDDPRAAREHGRISYLHFDDGIASFAMLPNARAGRPGAALLLAFPSPPRRRLVAAPVFAGLHAITKLDGSLEERTSLLPVTYSTAEVIQLLPSLEGVKAWAADGSLRLEERVLSAARGYLAAGWTLVGVRASAPLPPLGFRFRAERPTLPPNLLAAGDEWERVFLVTRAPQTLAGKERPVRALLRADELQAAMATQRADIRAARDLLHADAGAARAGALVDARDEQEAVLVFLSERLELSGADVASLLPPAAEGDNDDEALALVLTVIEGELSDGAPPDASAPTTRPARGRTSESKSPPRSDDGDGSPLVRRFEGNRIVRLLQKIWDDEEEGAPDDKSDDKDESEPDQQPEDPRDDKAAVDGEEPEDNSHGAAE